MNSRDITERKKAEQSVKESEEKFKNLAEQSPNMIFINKKGKVVYANKKAEETMGYTREEFYSPDFNFLTLHAPKSAELVKTNFAKHMHGEDTAPLEIRLVTKQGRVIDATMATKLIDYEGEQAILGTITEMTDQRKAEKAIQESEKKFQALFSGNPEATVYTDPSMHILDINPRFFSLFGHSLDEVKDKQLNDVVVPKGLVEEGRMLDKKTVKGYVYHDTVRMRKDGSLIPVSISAAPIFIQGRLVGYIGVYKDISQQKKALAQFKALFIGNPEAAAYLGPDFCILDVNPRFEELFGYSLAEIKGKNINETVVPKEKMEEGKALDERAGGGYVYFDTFRKRKDGSLVPVSVSAAPILVEDSLIGHVAMYKDISELKTAESAMKEMMQKIVMMNEKLRVVGGLTRHDVKNKLSIITGNTYLNKLRLTDRREVIESFGDVESAIDAIVRIFDFARDYERLGVEELTYVDAQDAIKKAFSFFSDLRGVKIANECHGLTVFADSMLAQLFYNLIDNSLKYGEKITQIKIHYEKGQEGQLRLVYEDDGVGISKDAKSKIFSEGYSTGKGSGYGLYLIKKMMEVYGWTILETGEPGKGAQFTIIIPKTSQNGKENYLIT
jgi:PAS domain S-box-containing protein